MKTLIEVYRLNGSFYALEKFLRIACGSIHADLAAIAEIAAWNHNHMQGTKS